VDIGTAAFAQALDERSLYSSDGTDLLDTYGPLHTVAIDGGWVNAREHTHTTYGTLDAPGTDPTLDGPKHLEIQRTVAASQSADTTPTDETDLRTTRTAYGLPGDATGWTLKQPMRVTTVVPGGTDIINETHYNATTGLITQTRMPSAAGSATAVGTTKTTYYTAGTRNDAACVNSAWVNLACKTEPASQPTTTGLPKLPVTQTTYDWLGRPTTVTETVIDAAGATKTHHHHHHHRVRQRRLVPAGAAQPGHQHHRHRGAGDPHRLRPRQRADHLHRHRHHPNARSGHGRHDDHRL
jgi:hypothetical protein